MPYSLKIRAKKKNVNDPEQVQKRYQQLLRKTSNQPTTVYLYVFEHAKHRVVNSNYIAPLASSSVKYSRYAYSLNLTDIEINNELDLNAIEPIVLAETMFSRTRVHLLSGHARETKFRNLYALALNVATCLTYAGLEVIVPDPEKAPKIIDPHVPLSKPKPTQPSLHVPYAPDETQYTTFDPTQTEPHFIPIQAYSKFV